ncbi:redoxin domain-containing protein [Conexibacter sp. W3-3-2]|uniref:peroxiredoxin-like family protein n=1 Tax=Conexibacter sp. W3-3-2 TaxID=2675227 RepID=UPI0012B77BB1|nr:peroxiredoxin-like family protein [Conexibacter sp. W3-3-2]MTD43231.1 redoxin domain-containing protein [Conexibacter sp. W3-3-2]
MSSPEQTATPIADGVATVRLELEANVPPELLGAFDGQAEALAQRGAPDAPGVGDQAPRFTLPASDGTTVSLDELLADGPVVLAFYRGAWCPYCNVQLRAYQQALPEFAARGASLVAVSPQRPDEGEALRDAAALGFPVLTDAGAAVAADYGLAFEITATEQEPFVTAGIEVAGSNADGSWRLPTPGTFVIGQDGTILHAAIDGDFRRRAEPAVLLRALDDAAGA